MTTWYQTKIRFQREDEKGNNKTINQAFLFDAVSYTDAESRVYNYFSSEIPDFQLVGLNKMKLAEVFFIESNAELLWFKCRVQYIVFDEKTQQDKKVPYNMLISATSVREAYDLLADKLGTVQDYIISDINVTKILDVIPYEEPVIEDKLSQGNFRPLSEIELN